MTHMHSGYSGRSYDRWVERNSNASAFGKVQKQFWFTKSAVIRKFGKKEDEHIVSSDAELDAKIDLFRAIESTTKELQMLLAEYQNRLYQLAQEENNLGRLLKEHGKQDSSRAGKMMLAVGKSLGYTAQQRVALRTPLVRLFQEVDTFQTRAVEDTAYTVGEMEKVRTEYRGALMWMKNISQDFNPDHYQQLEKFREVQAIVKQKKSKFDQMKIKSLQKIDLLAASRCNMFSHALILYQNSLISFSEKTAKTLNTVASNFKGYQPYKFQVIKELVEPKGMFDDDEENDEKTELVEGDEDDKTFFGEDYHDEECELKNKLHSSVKSGIKKKSEQDVNEPGSLLNLDEATDRDEKLILLGETQAARSAKGDIKSFGDLLSEDVSINSNMSTQELLKELFESPVHKPETENQALPIFGSNVLTTGSFDIGVTERTEGINQMFLPSHLLDFGFEDQATASAASAPVTNSPLSSKQEQKVASFSNTNLSMKSLQPKREKEATSLATSKDTKKLDWYKVFQDIDPLADPGNAIFGPLSEDKKC